jgi:uncharacterized protein YegJ (DUF2314 family)
MKFIAFTLALFAAACSPPAGGGPEDARLKSELAAATEAARGKLAYFWEHFEAPEVDEYDFVLKAVLPRGDGEAGEEQVWVENIARDADAVYGDLSVTPQFQPGLVRGDPVTFPETAILDWAFFRGEELIGHYTTRVLLQIMPPDEAEIMRALFGDNPE